MVAEVVDNTKRSAHSSTTETSSSEIPFQFQAGILATSILDLLSLLESVLEMENKNRQEQASFVNDQSASVREASSATASAGQAALNYAIAAGVGSIAGGIVGGALAFSGAAGVAGVNTSDEDSTISENQSMIKGLTEIDGGESVVETIDGDRATPSAQLTARDMEDNLDNLLGMLQRGDASSDDINDAISTVKKANFQFDQAKAQAPAIDADGNEIEGSARAANLEDAFAADVDDDRSAYDKKQSVSEKIDKVKDVLSSNLDDAKTARNTKVSTATSKQQFLSQIQNTVLMPMTGALSAMLQGGGQAAQATLNAAASNANSTADIFKAVAGTFSSETEKMAKMLTDLYQTIGNISRSVASIGSKLS